MESHPFTGKVIGCAIEVHRVLGPGLLINFNVQRLADGIDRFKLYLPLCSLCNSMVKKRFLRSWCSRPAMSAEGHGFSQRKQAHLKWKM
jgi:hypothetical protein